MKGIVRLPEEAGVLLSVGFKGRPVMVAVGMWKSRSDFQGRMGAEGNPFLVFLRVLGPAFPQPFFMHCAFFKNSRRGLA